MCPNVDSLCVRDTLTPALRTPDMMTSQNGLDIPKKIQTSQDISVQIPVLFINSWRIPISRSSIKSHVHKFKLFLYNL
ncbi:unnamed protein product [Allacma fusca]|uniref:Uncharacterized protein n=1 Tax=Allacma fusca TaxID=39272 RepID=A0A8J2LGF0_9HEXA|nr:unnamed protein product [Allacma fusca]